MECFSYKSGCGIHERMHIKAFIGQLAKTVDKRLQIISYIMLLTTVICTSKKIKNKAT